MENRLIKRLSIFLFVLLAATALFYSVTQPFHNWDVIGYIAAAKSFEEKDINSIHTFTFQQLQESVSSSEYSELASGSDYRTSISSDPSALREQLPFYQIRPLYNGLVYILYKAGMNIVFATHFISGAAVAAAILLLYDLVKNKLTKPIIYFMPVFIIIFKIFDLARYSTPDGLAFFAFFMAIWLYTRGDKKILFAFLPSMLFIRTDLILVAMPLLIIMVFNKSIDGWKAGLSIVASIAIFLGIGAYFQNPGWATTFYFTIVDFLPYPISNPPIMTMEIYLQSFIYGLKSLVKNPRFFTYILMCIACFCMAIKNRETSLFKKIFTSPAYVILTVSFVDVVGRFVILPVSWDRFYSAPYLIGALAFVMVIDDYLRTVEKHPKIESS